MLIEIKILQRNNEATTSNSRNQLRSLVLKCDKCGNIFERKWLKKTYEAKHHYCKIECHYSNRGGVGGFGAEVLDIECFVCKKSIKVRKIGNSRKWAKTCSRKCYGIFRSQNSDLYKDNTSLMHTEESTQKIKENIQKRIEEGWASPFKGKKHSEEAKEKLRETKRLNPPVGEKNGMFGKNHSKESREKMSDSNSTGIINGSRRTYGKNRHVRGDYETKTKKNYHYRSSWELAAMKYLDKQEEISLWNYECLRIPYYYDNNKRWYVPDFLIEFSDGRKEIWEIKPKELIDTVANKLKTEASIKYCEENKINNYVILCKDDLLKKGIL